MSYGFTTPSYRIALRKKKQINCYILFYGFFRFMLVKKDYHNMEGGLPIYVFSFVHVTVQYVFVGNLHSGIFMANLGYISKCNKYIDVTKKIKLLLTTYNNYLIIYIIVYVEVYKIRKINRILNIIINTLLLDIRVFS